MDFEPDPPFDSVASMFKEFVGLAGAGFAGTLNCPVALLLLLVLLLEFERAPADIVSGFWDDCVCVFVVVVFVDVADCVCAFWRIASFVSVESERCLNPAPGAGFISSKSSTTRSDLRVGFGVTEWCKFTVVFGRERVAAELFELFELLFEVFVVLLLLLLMFAFKTSAAVSKSVNERGHFK